MELNKTACAVCYTCAGCFYLQIFINGFVLWYDNNSLSIAHLRLSSFNLSCRLHSKGGKFNSMKIIQCKKCSTNNTFGTKYCQHCGSPLTYRQSFTKMLASLNFDALAGLGQKNVSLAPLFTANLLGTKKPDVKRGKRIQIAAVPLPDGKWFCPDCGWKNLPGSLFCDNCSRHI